METKKTKAISMLSKSTSVEVYPGCCGIAVPADDLLRRGHHRLVIAALGKGTTDLGCVLGSGSGFKKNDSFLKLSPFTICHLMCQVLGCVLGSESGLKKIDHFLKLSPYTICDLLCHKNGVSRRREMGYRRLRRG